MIGKFQNVILPAPTGGLNAIDPISEMPINDAYEMVNMWASEGAIEIRAGYFVTLGGIRSPLKTAMSYNDGVQDRIFLTGQDRVIEYFHENAPPTVATSKVDITDLFLSWLNFGTPAGHFLFCVNGSDAPFYFDGTSWTNSAITGTGLDINKLSVVHEFAERLFFIEKNTLNFWYLAVQSISGAASKFRLGSIFSKGGALIGMASLSVDGGDGINDLIAFITDQGQIALYQGTNPSDADNWGLVAKFNIQKPIGKRFSVQFGGDVLLLTSQGVLSMTDIYRDPRTARQNSPARKINPLIVEAFKANPNDDRWFIYHNPVSNRLYVNVPISSGGTKQYVMNTQKQVWTSYENINLYDFVQIDDAFYGIYTDQIFLFEYGNNDNRNAIRARIKQAYTKLGTASKKEIKAIQPFFRVKQNEITHSIKMDVCLDFKDIPPENTIDTVLVNPPLWDQGIWDVTPLVPLILDYNDINSIGGLGNNISLSLELSSKYDSFQWFETKVFYDVSQRY